MTTAEELKPTSRKRAAELVKAALQVLDGAGGDLPFRDILAGVKERVTLTPQDTVIYEGSGLPRWRAVLHFYSIQCVKAGLIRKAGGRWYLLEEGKKALAGTDQEIIETAVQGYRKWKGQRQAEPSPASSGPAAIDTDEPIAGNRAVILETAENRAHEEIRDYLFSLTAYEFQDIVAALLRGMGYHTPFVAPKGPDGGTDIIAYSDPLGTAQPHIRVQVKHRREAKATREEVAALRGIVHSGREIGLFVSCAGFTSDAQREARQGNVHIETIGLERLLALWIEHYGKLSEEDRGLLRLRAVYFLAPD